MAALASVVVAAAGVTDDDEDDNDNADDDMVDSCFRSFEFRKAEVAEQQQRMMRAQIEQDKLRMKPE
jgi:hypothetical protein